MNFNISLLLERYKNLKDPKEDRKKIAKIISEVVGVEITEEKVGISKNTLTLKLDNYIRTEVFMKQEKLIEALKKENFFISSIR